MQITQVNAGWRYTPVNVCAQYLTCVFYQWAQRRAERFVFQWGVCLGVWYSYVHWFFFLFFLFFWANNSPHKSPETWLESENEIRTELNFHFFFFLVHFFFFKDDSFQGRATIHIFCLGCCSDLCHCVFCLTLGASSFLGTNNNAIWQSP